MKLEVTGALLQEPCFFADCNCCYSLQLARAMREAPDEDLEVSVNSPGGDIFALFDLTAALTDWCIAHPSRALTLTVEGMAASAAAALLCLCPRKRAKVVLHRDSRIMYHGAMTTLFDAGARQLEDQMHLLDNFNRSVITALLAVTDLDAALVAAWFEPGREGWLDADQALACGLAHEILDADGAPAPVLPPKVTNLLRRHDMIKTKKTNRRPKNEAAPAPADPEKTEGEEDPVIPAEPAPQEPQDDDTPPFEPDPAPAPDGGEEPAPAAPKEEPVDEGEEDPEDPEDMAQAIDALRREVAGLKAMLAKSERVNDKLTRGLKASMPAKRAAAPQRSFAEAVRDMQKAHPDMSYDDCFCAVAQANPELHRSAIITRSK